MRYGFSLLFLCFYSMGAMTADLMPEDHSICETFRVARKIGMRCPEEQQFYLADDGRCGCLSRADITPADVCSATSIDCNEKAGYTFAGLYQDLYRCGPTEISYVGCGCYKTDM